MRNAGKRFENLKFRKKLILVFGLSLIFSLTLSLFMLASYFISVLRQNARSNLRIACAAWQPFMFGICMSIRMASNSCG